MSTDQYDRFDKFESRQWMKLHMVILGDDGIPKLMEKLQTMTVKMEEKSQTQYKKKKENNYADIIAEKTKNLIDIKVGELTPENLVIKDPSVASVGSNDDNSD